MTAESDHTIGTIGTIVNEEYQEAAVIFAKNYPMAGVPPKHCLGTNGDCLNPPLRHGFCSRCRQRVLSCIRAKLPVRPNKALRASYAAYIRDHPHAAPKPRPRKDAMPPRTFTDGDLGAFPTPEEVKAGKAPVVAPEPAPMFDKWQPLVDDGKRILEATAEPMPAPATYTQLGNWLNEARSEIATYKKNLNSRAFLTAQIARLDDRLAEIAKLRQRLAELESE